MIATSPAALEGLLGLSAALGERIALAVRRSTAATTASARTYIAHKLVKLDDAEIAANRAGRSNDAKADAAVRFAAKVVRERGHVDEADVAALKAAGYDDAQVIEIVLHVALNTFTNYLNEVANTDIDFPPASARPAA